MNGMHIDWGDDEETLGGESSGSADSSGTACRAPIRVLVCQVGLAPEIQFLKADRSGSCLKAMQDIVGGLITSIELEQGIDLWCNDEGELLELPLNRVIPTIAPPLPEGFENCTIIRLGVDLAEPGQAAEWRIRGTFFLARCNEDGETVGLTDADVTRYMALFG